MTSRGLETYQYPSAIVVLKLSGFNSISGGTSMPLKIVAREGTIASEKSDHANRDDFMVAASQASD
jgi:hypothetical protein